MISRCIVLILLVLQVLFVQARVTASALNGSARTVHNSETATLPPQEVQCRELWRVGGESEIEEEFFGFIADIIADAKGNVYLVDSQLSAVRVFSADGAYLRTIGREGQGPGEFLHPNSAFLLGGSIGVLQTMPNKIELFEMNGKPLSTLSLDLSSYGGFVMLYGASAIGDALLLHGQVSTFRRGSVDYVHFLDVFVDGKPSGRLYETREAMSKTKLEFSEERISPLRRDQWAVGSNGCAYVASQKEYLVTVIQTDGVTTLAFGRSYDPRKRSKQEIDALYEVLAPRVRSLPAEFSLCVSDYDRDIQRLFLLEDACWILTSRGKNDRPKGSMGIFDVFDREGRFLQQVSLLGIGDPRCDHYYIVSGRLYVVIDAENVITEGFGNVATARSNVEPMTVICYEISYSPTSR